MAEKQTVWQRYSALVEEYGMVALATVLSLFVLEMLVLVTLLNQGVDFGPFVTWVHSTLGWDASGIVEAAGTFGVAYAITRVLKPFQLMLALVLTPIVARWWRGRGKGPEAPVEAPPPPQPGPVE